MKYNTKQGGFLGVAVLLAIALTLGLTSYAAYEYASDKSAVNEAELNGIVDAYAKGDVKSNTDSDGNASANSDTNSKTDVNTNTSVKVKANVDGNVSNNGVSVDGILDVNTEGKLVR